MKYWTRIQLAALAALVLTLFAMALLPYLVRDRTVWAKTDPKPRALRLNFSAPEVPVSDRPKRLIDPGAPTEEDVSDAELISSASSQAQDLSDAEGDEKRPSLDQIDEFEELGTPPAPPPSDPSPPVSATAIQEAPAEMEQETAEPSREEPETSAEAKEPELHIAEVAVEPAEAQPKPVAPPEPVAEEEPLPERFEVAQANPAPPVPVQELRATRGPEGGGALHSGFTSFEANKHALGEYMLGVRNGVEREWRTGLHLRYSGVSRTYALIECSIRPDGTLEYARIVEPGTSLTYAIICRQAIENASPFGPFPFDVPEIYRNENLVITWKFSYL